jgi:hypothetical protein
MKRKIILSSEKIVFLDNDNVQSYIAVESAGL